MRKFDLNKEAEQILTPSVINLLTEIHEYKGKQD